MWGKLASLLLICSLSAIIFANPALAQSQSRIPTDDTIPTSEQAKIPTGFESVAGIIATIFNVVFSLAGAIFVILLLVGGVQYLTSAGNEEATAKAKRLLIDAVIGLIITLAAYAVGIYILGRFGYKVTVPSSRGRSTTTSPRTTRGGALDRPANFGLRDSYNNAGDFARDCRNAGGTFSDLATNCKIEGQTFVLDNGDRGRVLFD